MQQQGIKSQIDLVHAYQAVQGQVCQYAPAMEIPNQNDVGLSQTSVPAPEEVDEQTLNNPMAYVT